MKKTFLYMLLSMLFVGCSSSFQEIFEGRWMILEITSDGQLVDKCLYLNLINFNDGKVELEMGENQVDPNCRLFDGLHDASYTIKDEHNRLYLQLSTKSLQGFSGVYKVRFNALKEENSMYCELKSDRNVFILKKNGYRELYKKALEHLLSKYPDSVVK